MMIRAALASLLFVVTAQGSAQSIDRTKIDRVPIKIQDTTDKFTGARWIRTQRAIPLEKTGFLTTLALSPGIIIEEGKRPIFYAAIYYSGYGWAFLDGNAYFIADGKRYSASGSDSSKNRNVAACSASAGCINEEVERLAVSRELAHALANATDAEVKVTGQGGPLTGRLNEKHIAYFRAMVERYEALGGIYMQPDGAAQPATTERSGAEGCAACRAIANSGKSQSD